MRRKLIPYNPKLKELAKKLRNDSTLGEVLLWKELNNKLAMNLNRMKIIITYFYNQSKTKPTIP